MSSLPKTVTRQRHDRFEPGPSAPVSSTFTTQLPSHPRDLQQIEIMELEPSNKLKCQENFLLERILIT